MPPSVQRYNVSLVEDLQVLFFLFVQVSKMSKRRLTQVQFYQTKHSEFFCFVLFFYIPLSDYTPWINNKEPKTAATANLLV